MTVTTVGAGAGVDALAPTAQTRKQHRSGASRREAGAAWLLAAPFCLVFLSFSLLPVLASFAMSFTDITNRDIRTPFDVDFVGFEHYLTLFRDPRFWNALRNTLVFVLAGVPLTMLLGFVLALALNNGIRRWRTLFRVGYYTPVVTSIIAVGVVWRVILQPDGLLNAVLGWFGITGPHWLHDPNWALPALIMMAVWRNFGTLMVIFLAGLQTVPQEVLEAATVDGAGPIRRTWSIVVPIMRQQLLFGAIVVGIGFVQFFDEPFIMTQGGPLDSTNSIALHTYQQFTFGNYGLAAASSYVMFAAVALLSLIQFRLAREKD